MLQKSPIVENYKIKRKRIGQYEGFVEIEVMMIKDTKLELFEYYSDNEITDYRYHVMDLTDNLIVRWDNAPHHKQISTFPHHKHIQDEVFSTKQVDLIKVLKEIPNYW